VLAKRYVVYVGGALFVLLVGCGDSGAVTSRQASAESTCSSVAQRLNATVLRAYPTTGQAYDTWRASRPGHPRSFDEPYLPTDALIVCYLAGDFGPLRNPPLPGKTPDPNPPHYQESDVVVLPNGNVIPDRTGMESDFPSSEPGPSPLVTK
jgi:hypothetical protein